MESIRAIEQLMSDFAWHADRGEWDSLARLFTSDGVLTSGTQTSTGPAQIAQDAHRRTAGSLRVTRHVWSNLRVQTSEADFAKSTATQLTFEQTQPDAPAQVRVSDLSDTFRRGSDGVWQFESRLIVRKVTVGA